MEAPSCTLQAQVSTAGRMGKRKNHCFARRRRGLECEENCGEGRPGAFRTRMLTLAGWGRSAKTKKKMLTLIDLCVSSLRRGHANLLCIVPLLTGDPRRESSMKMWRAEARPVAACRSFRRHCVCSRSGRPPSPFPLQLPLARVDLPPKVATITGFCD